MAADESSVQLDRDASSSPLVGAVPAPVATDFSPPITLDDGGLNITAFLPGGCFLVTGATGFMGTMLVEKILREAPEGTKIYVPIRDAPNMSFEDRFWKKVLPRAFFDTLRKQHGSGFEDFIRAHLIPLRGDLDQPLLGFSPDVVAKLQDEVQMVVHCAANTGFHVPLDEIMATNVGGWQQVMQLAAGCKNLQVCTTISTAYVHGGRGGILPEVAMNPGAPPSLFCPLVPTNGQFGASRLASDGGPEGTTVNHGNGTSHASANVADNGHTTHAYTNGHSRRSSNGHSNGTTNGHSRHGSNGHSKGTTNGHSRRSSNGTANGHSRHNSDAQSNGTATGHSRTSSMNGHSGRQESIPGIYLDLDCELDFTREAVLAVEKELAACGLKGRELTRHRRKLLTAAGKQRARQFGWHDSYTYSKALAELAGVAVAQEHNIPLVLLRPTIVESAMQEPIPGIIDSIACMEPLIFALARGAMDGFPANGSLPLDVVPVDLATNGILASLAASAGRPGVHVYQIGTSQCNPLTVGFLNRVQFEYFRKYPMHDDITGELFVREEVPQFFPDLASFSAALEAKHEQLLQGMDTSAPDGSSFQESLAQSRKFMLFLAEIYRPYTNYEGVFTVDNLLALWRRLPAAEQACYPFALDRIMWRDYLWNTHFPGIRRFLLDEDEEDWKFDNDSTLTVGRNF